MIGDILQELRKDSSIDQEDLAQLFGISRSAISSYERGVSDPPSVILVMYSRKFNVSIDFLCGLTRDRTSVGDRVSEFEYGKNPITLSEVISNINMLSSERRHLIFDLLTQLKQAQEHETKCKKKGKTII